MFSTRSRLLIASSAIVLAAPLVRAADTPTLDKLDREQVKRGSKSNVKASGANFGEKLEDITVTVGSVECKVLEVAPKSFRFQVPDSLPIGPASVTIKVHGTTLTAKLQVVEKLTQPDPRNNVENPGGGPVIPPPPTSTKLTLVGGDAPSAVVEGTTEIPVGLTLECQLVLVGGSGEDDCIIETKKFRIDKPQFKVTFGPYTGQTLCTGKYFAMTEFFLEHASKIDLKKVKWDTLDNAHHRSYAHIWSRDTRDWGTPDEAKKENDELKYHYNEVTKSATATFESLERAFGVAGKWSSIASKVARATTRISGSRGSRPAVSASPRTSSRSSRTTTGS